MRVNTILTYALLMSLVTVAIFGLYFPIGMHMAHGGGCPFAPGGTSLCGAPLTHLRNWQSAFSGILDQVSYLYVTFAMFLVIAYILILKDAQFERYRYGFGLPSRPLLFEELYSSGILNRKEPSQVAFQNYTLN